MIQVFLLVAVGLSVSAHPFSPFEFAESLPPFGIPIVEPPEETAKELDIEKIAKALELDKSWPFAEKEASFEKGFDFGLGASKELELEKEFSKFSLEKSVAGYEKAFPWQLYEKYFGLAKKLTFEQALAFELYKLYGYYGLWVARELQRRFLIAKELGLIGKEIAFQEAIGLGLFKGIGLEKIFESVNKAIGVEKKFDFDKTFGIFKKF